MIPIGAFPEIYREYPENMYKVNPYLVLKYNRDWVMDSRPDLHGINEAIALLPPLFDGMSRKKMAHALAISPNLAWVVNDSWLFDRCRHTHDNIVQNQFTCDTGLVDAQIKRVQIIVARMEKAKKIMAKMHD
jgi:hypothetical protein